MNPNTDFIPFAKPSLSAEEEEAVLSVIRSGWLTTGGVTAEFEKRVASAAAVKYALAVNSSTSGLHLALEAVGTKRGDYVITSPYTFTATAEIIRYIGAHPLFVDIEENSYNISADLIEKTLSKARDRDRIPEGARISAVIPVHIGGYLCRRKEILEIAGRYGLEVIEDGAHLQPSPLLNDENSIIVYSFYATKCIATGEGGMVITNNSGAAERMKMMRFHGIDREAWDRYTNPSARAWEYDVKAPGFKYNMPDIASAIGLVQLKKSAEMLRRRQEIAERYDAAFTDCGFLIPPPSSPECSRHLYILRLDEERLGIGRDDFAGLLSEAGIGISVHYKPLHLMSYYSSRYGLKPDDFPESLKKYRSSFSLPIYPDLTDDEVSRIIETVLETGRRYRRN